MRFGKDRGAALAEPQSLDGALTAKRVNSADQTLTTNQGVAVSDNQSSLKAGLRGPTLLEDFILREKITHFDHERIPERIVHARGSGAHGYFEAYEPLPELTRATVFAEAGKQTPVFVRFSTVAGERGSADTARDVRGFAVKFYTDEGNWDLVGNNIPVFFIQDAMKFPDLIHAVKPEPHNQIPQAASAHDTFWDFVSLMPESTHMLLWVMSDRAIPRSLRMMQGFGVHTFRLVNSKGESTFCKFHWKPVLGTHSLVWDEAVKIAGADPDFHRRDLWEAIESGHYPEWELGLQTFSEADAEKFSFDVLDATKLIPEELVPVTPVGRMVLNRNPDNFFAETEQVAFCTAHVIPGIDFSNDPLLHGRIHSYVDTQLTRLGGPNFHEIPINAPLVPVHNNQRDGLHRQAIARGRVAYEPNSLGGGCPFQAGAKGFVSFAEVHRAGQQPHRQGARQTREICRALRPGHLVLRQPDTPGAGAYHRRLPLRIEQGHGACHPAARRFLVAQRLGEAWRRRWRTDSEWSCPRPCRGCQEGGQAGSHGVPGPVADRPTGRRGHRDPKDRHTDGQRRGRRADQFAARCTDTQPAPWHGCWAAGSGASRRTDGDSFEVDATFENSPSVLFDAVVLPDGAGGRRALSREGHAVEFLKDQYRHCKTTAGPGRLVPAAAEGRNRARAAFG